MFLDRIKVTRLLATSPDTLLRKKAVNMLERIINNHSKYDANQENSDTTLITGINDSAFVNWVAHRRGQDFEDLDHDH